MQSRALRFSEDEVGPRHCQRDDDEGSGLPCLCSRERTELRRGVNVVDNRRAHSDDSPPTMEIVNKSNLPAEAFSALDKSGREHLVIVAKATYRFGPDRTVELAADAHRPIAATDVFVGQPGFSAPIYEADFVHRKQSCDVLVNATAHAPGGRAVTELRVALRVGDFTKRILAVGDRVWKKGAFGVSATRPEPFIRMPLHYGRAFGGSPAKKLGQDGSAQEDTYFANPIGTGYSSDPSADILDGMPLPATEDVNDRISAPNGKYRPLALGPIGRHWDPRRKYAGSYGASWRSEVFPFLPDDFDEAFFQAAPPDQQIAFPRGGEVVALHHLIEGRTLAQFELPAPNLSVKVLFTSRRAETLQTVVDTLFIEPESGLFTYVYRASTPLDRRGVHSVKLVATGPVCEQWWKSKVFGLEDCGCGGDPEKDPVPPALRGAADEGDEPNLGDAGTGSAGSPSEIGASST